MLVEASSPAMLCRASNAGSAGWMVRCGWSTSVNHSCILRRSASKVGVSFCFAVQAALAPEMETSQVRFSFNSMRRVVLRDLRRNLSGFSSVSLPLTCSSRMLASAFASSTLRWKFCPSLCSTSFRCCHMSQHTPMSFLANSMAHLLPVFRDPVLSKCRCCHSSSCLAVRPKRKFRQPIPVCASSASANCRRLLVLLTGGDIECHDSRCIMMRRRMAGSVSLAFR